MYFFALDKYRWHWLLDRKGIGSNLLRALAYFWVNTLESNIYNVHLCHILLLSFFFFYNHTNTKTQFQTICDLWQMMGVRWWGWSWAACTPLSNMWRTKLGSHPLYASPGAKVWGHEGFSLFYFRSSSTENITISQRTSTISVLTCMSLNDFDIKRNHDCPITWQHRRWPHPPRRQDMCVS